MFRVLWALIIRDLCVYWRNRSESFLSLGHFIILSSLFSLILSLSGENLSFFIPGILWAALLFSLLHSFESLFRQDYENGTLEQWILGRYPLAWLCLGKSIAHILAIGVPLFMLASLIGCLLFTTDKEILGFIMSLALGIPSVSLVGALGAALTIGLPRGGALIALCMLPLLVPVLLLGVKCSTAPHFMMSFQGEFLLLGALLILSIIFVPLAVASALKASIE